MSTARVASSRQDDLLPLCGGDSMGSRVDQTWTEKEEASKQKEAESAWHEWPEESSKCLARMARRKQ